MATISINANAFWCRFSFILSSFCRFLVMLIIIITLNGVLLPCRIPCTTPLAPASKYMHIGGTEPNGRPSRVSHDVASTVFPSTATVCFGVILRNRSQNRITHRLMPDHISARYVRYTHNEMGITTGPDRQPSGVRYRKKKKK